MMKLSEVKDMLEGRRILEVTAEWPGTRLCAAVQLKLDNGQKVIMPLPVEDDTHTRARKATAG